jgi:Thioredoxin
MKALVFGAALAAIAASPTVAQVTFSGPPVDISREREPVIVLGSKSAPRKMMFLWASDCGDSAAAFRNTIRPLLETDVKANRLQIIMVHYARVQSELDSTALITQCVPAGNYQRMVTTWLSTLGTGVEGTRYTQPFNGRMVPPALVSIGRQNGLPANLDQCVSEARKTRLLSTRQHIDQRVRVSETPTFLIRGTAYGKNTSLDQIRAALGN